MGLLSVWMSLCLQLSQQYKYIKGWKSSYRMEGVVQAAFTGDIFPENWDIRAANTMQNCFHWGSRAGNAAHPFAGLQLEKKGSFVSSLLSGKSALTDLTSCPTKPATLWKIGSLLGQVSWQQGIANSWNFFHTQNLNFFPPKKISISYLLQKSGLTALSLKA